MKKFKYVLALFYISVAISAIAQTGKAQVNGSVLDTNSVPWAYATVTFTLNNPSGQPPINTATGLPVQPIIKGQTVSSGQFGVSVDINADVVPFGTSWNLSICPVTGQDCYTKTGIVSISTGTSIGTVSEPLFTTVGSEVQNVNSVSQLTNPTIPPKFGRLAIVGNQVYMYDVTTMNWIEAGGTLTPTQIASALTGQTISPAVITATTSISTPGTITTGGGLVGVSGSNLIIKQGGTTSNLFFENSSGGTLCTIGTTAVLTCLNTIVGNSLEAVNTITNAKGMQIATGTPCVALPGASCIVTVTLPNSEPDTNYTVTGCMQKNGDAGAPVAFGVGIVTTTAFDFSVWNFGTTSTDTTGTWNCLVIHN